MEEKILRIVDNELMFELKAPDGHEWKIYLDGNHQGFPEGTIIGNHAHVIVSYLKGLLIKKSEHIRNVYTENEQPKDMGKEE